MIPLGCADDPSPGDAEAGDGDGDTDTGDGDGDPGDGDGDGEPGDGDGDGDGEPGDGDGGGDGDGDGEPGDGDGDGDGDGLPSNFIEQLTEVGGCGDVYIAATNPEATMAIMFDGAPLAATAHMLGEAQVRESVLPSADVSLTIALGSFLDQGCNDAGQSPILNSQWTAVSGTVTLTVVPVGMQQPFEVPAEATLQLTDVTFEGVGLDPVNINSWTVADVYVGWFPG
ncbi:MAG TPA: hypothetical protein VM869_08400 [Enhygromyxa sp.]|nr:hypothetical protein [Enhygromyxa sp.]